MTVEMFRRRPMAVETMLWDGTPERAEQIREWVGVIAKSRRLRACMITAGETATLWVEHSQQWVPVPIGHRIVRESDGNGFYPISPEAVEATWEPIGRDA